MKDKISFSMFIILGIFISVSSRAAEMNKTIKLWNERALKAFDRSSDIVKKVKSYADLSQKEKCELIRENAYTGSGGVGGMMRARGVPTDC